MDSDVIEKAFDLACKYIAQANNEKDCGFKPNSEYCMDFTPCNECTKAYFIEKAKKL